jgi:DNA-binding NtrC family response regulator
MARRVLLVDDDPTILSSIGEALGDMGLEVGTAGSAEAALERLAKSRPDVVLSDIRMPGLSGLELLSLIRERAPDIDVVLMTAYDDMPTVVSAMREGAFDFLVKPLDFAELEDVLRRALADRRARQQRRQAADDEARQYQMGELVGRDPRMIEVYKRVGQLAANPVTVLIRGESGTAEPFVAVNCTALPETLLESELFGHVRGSFTGAMADRRGRFALAGCGTIFLDEIGDTSPGFQAKILRVLEEQEVMPVGGERPEPSEARVIAATHRDLEERVQEGKFREDLYYRLRVVEIALPPLRERPGDIPLLARHLAGKVAERLHRSEPRLPDATVEALLRHDWPGNVRELENCLTRAIALATGGVIRQQHLGLGDGPQDRTSSGVLRNLQEVEIEHVRHVLTAADGNKTRAAEILGISKPRLYRLLEKHGSR